MTNGVVGSRAMPATITTTKPQGGPALRVYRDDTLVADGGPATPVYLVSAAEVAAGTFVPEGNVAIPMRVVSDGRAVAGSVPIAVYVVN